MKPRCYCCGEQIKGKVALVSMSFDNVDRVFVMKPDHVVRVDDAVSLIVVPASNSYAARELAELKARK